MTIQPPSWSLGAVMALIVLVLVLLLFILGRLPMLETGLFAALAVARLT